MVRLMERAFNFVFNDDDEMTWLLGEETTHWSFDLIPKKLLEKEKFQFDNLYIYCRFDYDQFFKIWKSCCHHYVVYLTYTINMFSYQQIKLQTIS